MGGYGASSVSPPQAHAAARDRPRPLPRLRRNAAGRAGRRPRAPLGALNSLPSVVGSRADGAGSAPRPPPAFEPSEFRDSGIPKRSIPPPIKTWLGKSAGGRLMAVYCSTSWRVWTPPPVSPTPTPARGMVDWCHQTGAGAERTLAGPSKGGGGILRWPSAAQGGRRTLGSLSDRRGRRARRPVERNGRSESVWRPVSRARLRSGRGAFAGGRLVFL